MSDEVTCPECGHHFFYGETVRASLSWRTPSVDAIRMAAKLTAGLTTARPRWQGAPPLFDVALPIWKALHEYQRLMGWSETPVLDLCWVRLRSDGRRERTEGELTYRRLFGALVQELSPVLELSHSCQNGGIGCVNPWHCSQVTAFEHRNPRR